MDFAGKSSYKTIYPINDLDERAWKKNYSDLERQLRCQLACVYRLVDLYDWSEGVYNHITCRLPGEDDRFLINPFGLLYHEITASSLITVDAQGNILDAGSTHFSLNPRGFTLHSAVHMHRPDAQCVLHLHLPETISISCTKEGFVAVCQEGATVGPVPILEFQGILTELDERECIVKALGNNNALLLRNHGFVVCGETVPDAMLKAFWFIYNIRAQLHLACIDKNELRLPSAESMKRTYHAMRQGEKTVQTRNVVTSHQSNEKDTIHWGPGEMDWEAEMRLLDSMGLKSGHKYRLASIWRE